MEITDELGNIFGMGAGFRNLVRTTFKAGDRRGEGFWSARRRPLGYYGDGLAVLGGRRE